MHSIVYVWICFVNAQDYTIAQHSITYATVCHLLNFAQLRAVLTISHVLLHLLCWYLLSSDWRYEEVPRGASLTPATLLLLLLWLGGGSLSLRIVPVTDQRLPLRSSRRGSWRRGWGSGSRRGRGRRRWGHLLNNHKVQNSKSMGNINFGTNTKVKSWKASHKMADYM